MTPWSTVHQASITNSQSLPKLMCIELVIPSNHLILCHPLLLQALNLSQHQGLFQWVSSSHQVARVLEFELQHHSFQWINSLHQVTKYWSFSFTISPSSEYSGLISFRINWLDLPAVQGTLKNLLQHHSPKASILQCSAFFIVQRYIHTWLLGKPKLWLDGPLLANHG